MPVWVSAVLGFIQGLCEFLPISSSGHLALAQNFFGFDQYMGNDLMFNVVLHLGTLVAVCAAFWRDILGLFRDLGGLFKDGFKTKKIPGRRLIVMLLLATVPLAVGALISKYVEAAFGSTLFIGCALIVTAFMLFVSDRFKGGKRNAGNAGYGSALVVGLSQLIAVFPGISRSGATICAGIYSGYKRDFAVRFAFLLSIPAVLGAAVFELKDVASSAAGDIGALCYIVGFLTAAVFGYLAIFTVRLLVKRGSFKYFAFYCAAVGVASIIATLVK